MAAAARATAAASESVLSKQLSYLTSGPILGPLFFA